MSPAVKNILMLVVLLGALVGAGFFFTHSKKERTYPDDPSLATQWICTKCSNLVSLTPARYKEWASSKDKIRRDPNYPGRLFVFWCDKCNDFTLVRAGKDSKSGEWYPTTDTTGNPNEPPSKAAPEPKKPTKPAK